MTQSGRAAGGAASVLEANRGAASALMVELGGEVFGFSTDAVELLFPLAAPEVVPLAPEFVVGLQNYRGKAVAVLAIDSLLGVRPVAPVAGKPVLLCRTGHGAQVCGILCDRAQSVVRVNPAGDLPARNFTLAARDERGEAVRLVDVAAILEHCRQAFDGAVAK